MKPFRLVTASLIATALSVPLAAPAAAATPADRQSPGNSRDERLRSAAPAGFRIGSAVAGGGHHANQPYPPPFTSDEQYREILASEFSSVSPENQMKWEYIHPERNRYDFAAADAIIEFAERNDQVIRGHTLLWHKQNPAWLEQGDFSDSELRAILREHIMTVVGRYKGRIQQWDVANEIFDSNGNLRAEENIWIRELGPGIIADAFRWAHQADPNAELFFNDYGVASNNAKSDAYYSLIKSLLAKGVPVHGFSVQGHLSMQYPFPSGLEQNLRRFAELGLSTAITELDVRMNLPESGEPTEAQLAKQADYYQQALMACLNVRTCDSFTIWGFTDKYSWVPVFFEGQGAATVMRDDFTRKPAYYALRSTLVNAGPPGDSSCRAEYTVHAWHSGLVANIVVTNTGTTPVHGWTLDFTLPSVQRITSGWNAKYSLTAGAVTATNVSYNAMIEPGRSIRLGMLAEHTGGVGRPKAITLNGTACSIS